MNQKRNQTKVVNVFTVFMVMLILYFIVGLFTVINQQFQIPLQTAMLPHDGNITNALVTMLNFSWFLAYPLSEGFGTRWLEKYGYRKSETVMIGDRLYTDIASGYNAGVDTIFVLSGEGTLADLDKSDVKPTHVFTNIREIYNEL